MRLKRSTFRRRSSPACNLASIARRDIRRSNERNNWLYNPNRQRDASEIKRMEAAAQRRPHGRAARMLANGMKLA